MIKYVYRVVDLASPGRRQSLEDMLNALGEQGWKLSTVISPHLGVFCKEADDPSAYEEHPVAAPAYRDPETGETWAGRGRMPLWLSNRIKAGAVREDFKIR